MSTITVEHLVIALLGNGSTCRGILARWGKLGTSVVLLACTATPCLWCCCRLGFSPDSVKANAHKKLLGDQEAEGAKKKVTVCILSSVARSWNACATCSFLQRLGAACIADRYFQEQLQVTAGVLPRPL